MGALRTLLETPPRAVEDGRPLYGIYKRPFACLNLLDAGATADGSGGLPRWRRSLRLKEWEHFGVFAGPYFLGVAMVDLKLAGLSWCCLFHRPSGTLAEQRRRLLPGRVRIPPALVNGSCELRAGGGYRVSVENRLGEGFHRLRVRVAARQGFPGVHADLVLWERPEQVQPIIALLPLGEGRPFFSHKAPCFPEGTLRVGAETLELSGRESVALLDFHRALYPRHTFWEWATFAGFDRRGDLIGMNLTRNVIQRDDLHNENGVWFRNTLHPVGPAEFRIPRDRAAPWHIRSRDGHVDVVFRPLGQGRSETVRLGPFHGRYVQPLGLFSGKLQDGAGVVHAVEDVMGMAEDHRVAW